MSNEEMYAIYNIIDERDGHVFYVGATKNMHRRMKEHLRGETPARSYIVQMQACGVHPLFSVLESVATVEVARCRESFWYKHFRAMGMHVLESSNVSYSGGYRCNAGRKAGVKSTTHNGPAEKSWGGKRKGAGRK